MNETEEREITKYLQEVIEEKKIEILAYNICKDHIHLILKCEEKKRNYIVQRLKSTSARKYNINHGFTISQKNKGASSLDRGISQNHFR